MLFRGKDQKPVPVKNPYSLRTDKSLKNVHVNNAEKKVKNQGKIQNLTRRCNLANFPLPERTEKNGVCIRVKMPNAGDYHEKDIPAQHYLEEEKTWIQGENGNQGRKKSSECQKTQRSEASGSIVLDRHCLERVRKSWHFRKILKNGSYFRGGVLRARYMKNSLGRIRLGFSVSAKTGNAVKRNLFKRRLRQYSVEKTVSIGYDAVVFPLVFVTSLRWEQIKEDMDRLTEEIQKKGE